MDNKKIHTLGSAITFSSAKVAINKVNDLVIITELRVGNIKIEKIKKILKSISSQNDEGLEKAVQTRNVEKIGMFILMEIYQVIQDEVKKEKYQ